MRPRFASHTPTHARAISSSVSEARARPVAAARRAAVIDQRLSPGATTTGTGAAATGAGGDSGGAGSTRGAAGGGAAVVTEAAGEATDTAVGAVDVTGARPSRTAVDET